MDQNKIDRLFREKLDHLEVKPSARSWTAVEKQIQPNRGYGAWYWMAASLALLLTIWIVWPSANSTTGTPIQAEVNQPTQQQMPELKLPIAEPGQQMVAEQASKRSASKRKVVAKQVVVQKSIPMEGEDEEKVQPEMQAIEPTQAVALAEVEAPNPPLEEVGLEESEEALVYQPVKITYIASSNEKPKDAADKMATDSTGVIKKFIAFTEKIDPGEMLADIRNAKDNLLSSGFKSKKDKNSL